MNDPNTGMDTEIYIGPAVARSVDTLLEYQALDTGGAFVEIDLVESIPEIGDESQIATFTGLKHARVFKAKGARDAGGGPLVVAEDLTNLGQQALIAAEKTSLTYAFKEVRANGALKYYKALVTSNKSNSITNGEVIRTTFTLAVNGDVFVVAAP